MKLLALDTATEACTVALSVDDRILERFELRSQHSEHLLPMVDSLLAEAQLALGQLDAIAFGRGPGSFTGLRIGAGVAQGLAFGADLPVVAVSSLATLAQGEQAHQVLAAFDARMQQVYWGAYRREADGVMVLAGSEQVLAPSAVPVPEGNGWIGAGSGWDAFYVQLVPHLGTRLAGWHAQRLPRARSMVPLATREIRAGRAVPADHALPVYVRDEVATRAKPR